MPLKIRSICIVLSLRMSQECQVGFAIYTSLLFCLCASLGDIRLILRFTLLYCPIFRISYYKFRPVYYTRRWPQPRSSLRWTSPPRSLLYTQTTPPFLYHHVEIEGTAMKTSPTPDSITTPSSPSLKPDAALPHLHAKTDSNATQKATPYTIEMHSLPHNRRDHNRSRIS
jgi:hypothetical protein